MNSLDASRRRVAHGQGIACCFKNVGFSLGAPEACAAWVELQGIERIERAIVGCVGADVGQGAHTVFAQIAAEVLQIDPAQVDLRVDNTEITGSSGSASASRMTFMAGNAIHGAASTLRWPNGRTKSGPPAPNGSFTPAPPPAMPRQPAQATPTSPMATAPR